jgi:hypothetical protein
MVYNGQRYTFGATFTQNLFTEDTNSCFTIKQLTEARTALKRVLGFVSF